MWFLTVTSLMKSCSPISSVFFPSERSRRTSCSRFVNGELEGRGGTSGARLGCWTGPEKRWKNPPGSGWTPFVSARMWTSVVSSGRWPGIERIEQRSRFGPASRDSRTISKGWIVSPRSRIRRIGHSPKQ